MAYFRKTSEPNEFYKAPGKSAGENVENWFEMPELGDVTIEELNITDEVYFTRCTYREIIENEETKLIFRKYFGKRDEHPMFSMVLDMKIDTAMAHNDSLDNQKRINLMNKELMWIKKAH